MVMLQMITSISLDCRIICSNFHHSAAVYSFTANYSPKQLCDATVQLLKRSNIRESCYIRPIILVGLHGIDLNVSRNSPTYTSIIIFPFSKYFKGEGIKACVSSWRRIHDTATPPMAKAAGNYLNSVLATQECRSHGYDESIMLDKEGNVSEASGENIFVVRNNTIYTPYIAGSALEGITRDTALTIAGNLGYKTIERPISRTELYLADELFLTGTAAEIIAITSIDGRQISNGKEGPITRTIREMYTRIVCAEERQYMDWITPVW